MFISERGNNDPFTIRGIFNNSLTVVTYRTAVVIGRCPPYDFHLTIFIATEQNPCGVLKAILPNNIRKH